jgi:hypothetical protein
VTCLSALGHTYEALAFGRLQLERGRAAGLQTSLDAVELSVALAEARAQQYPSACERVERMIARSVELGAQGVLLGRLYEVRARIALWMGDELAFSDHALRCAQQYKKSDGDPALVAKYERLVREAAVAGTSVRGVRDTLTVARSLDAASISESEVSTTLIEEVDPADITRTR